MRIIVFPMTQKSMSKKKLVQFQGPTVNAVA